MDFLGCHCGHLGLSLRAFWAVIVGYDPQSREAGGVIVDFLGCHCGQAHLIFCHSERKTHPCCHSERNEMERRISLSIRASPALGNSTVMTTGDLELNSG